MTGPDSLAADALLAAIIDGADDAILSKRLDSTILSWNRGAQRLFGYEADEIIGKSIRILIPEDRQDEEDDILARIAAGKTVSAFETVRLHKDGSEMRVSVTVSPVRNPDGTIVGASKIVRDSSAWHAAQDALAQSENRFQLLANNIAQLVWIADADGAINWYNRRWYEFTGTTPEEMLGWGWTGVQHPDHLERVRRDFEAAIASGSEWEDTFPLRGADGRFRWFLSRAKPLYGEDGRIEQWFGSNTDVTRQREQGAAIENLLVEVNHRVKNTLTLIQALARRSAQGNDEFTSRFVRRIEALVVNQDLLVTRQWSGVPVSELVAAQLEFAISTAGPRLHSEGPDLAVTASAAETLGLALHELATNALKHGALSVPDGDVRIRWEVVDDMFTIRWHETGGPAVSEPGFKGFGSAVIRDMPAAKFGGEAVLDFTPQGVCWRLTCPLRVVAAD